MGAVQQLKVSCRVACACQVIADNETGLMFKNKRDRKVINVDPKVEMFAYSAVAW